MLDRHDLSDMVERITCGVSRNLARRGLVCALVGAGLAAAVVAVWLLRRRVADELDEGMEHEWDAAAPPEAFPDTLREEDGEEDAKAPGAAPRGRRRNAGGEDAPQPA